MRLSVPSAWVLCVLTMACNRPTAPTAPQPVTGANVETITLEAEAGVGQGDLQQRSRASGGSTIHLAPGQRRQWTFNSAVQSSRYAIFVTYSNDNPGDTEELRVEIDGQPIGAFHAQDTGDDGEGWNLFVADRAGASMLHAGTHVLTLESIGGDGCIEIDVLTLRPGDS